MKKHFKFYLLLFLLFLLGTLLGFFLSQARIASQKSTDSTRLTITTPAQNPDTNIIPPPSQALVGTVILKGTARIIKRDQSDWQPLADAQKVYQDERIVVDSGSLIVEFPQYLTIKTASNVISEFTLTNLLPSSFLIKETNGEISYETLKPISISTSTGGLVKLDTGRLNIIEDLQEETSTITLLSGSASLATIDPQNTTQVYKLTEGETVILDSLGEITLE